MATASRPIVTTMGPSVDPHLYRFMSFGLQPSALLAGPGPCSAMDRGQPASSAKPGEERSGGVVMALGELLVSFIGFANDFLGLLSCQALLSLDLEFDQFPVLFVGVHRFDLNSEPQR
jgi:hypothetical protein